MALNIDLAPTLLDLAGAAPAAAHQGESLVPLLRGEPPAAWRTDAFFEHLMANPRIPKWEGIRDGRWKYARYFEQDPPVEFLHDLQADPDELVNLAAEAANRADLARLRGRTDAVRDALGGPYSPDRFPTRRK